MLVALIALSVALGGTAGADPVGEISQLIRGKRIASNAITTKHVKNRSLLGADFKAGQLPRGARGASGPQGPQGPQGAQGPGGPAGPAGAFRAYTNVKVDTVQVPTLNRNKGFTGVRSPSVGYYCLTPSGIDPTSVPHFAGIWHDGPGYTGATVAADAGGQQCNLSEFQVNTFPDGGGTTGVVEFWVAVP